MVTLDYKLSDQQPFAMQSLDLSGASETDLDFYCFTGDLLFRLDAANFDARWSWLPLLHVAQSFYDSVEALLVRDSARIEFAESNASILIQHQGGQLLVSSNYTDNTGRTTMSDFAIAVESFMERLYAEIEARWPSVQKNYFFAIRRRRLDKRRGR